MKQPTLLFVCQNMRDPSAPQGSCMRRGSQEVLTRLADESYDLVFIDAAPADQPDFVVEGVRLRRPGGVIVVHRAALGGRAGDPGAADAEVSAVREAARLIAEDERLTPVLVPLGDGILVAARD